MMTAAMATGKEPASTGDGVATESPGTKMHDDTADAPGTGGEDARGPLQSNGSFAKLWNRQWFIGPRVFTLTEPLTVEGRRLPADFEPHRAVVLGAGWLAREAPEALAEMVLRMKPRRLLVLLVSSSDERDAVVGALTRYDVPPETVRFLTVPTDTGWVRDFGPIFVREAGGAVRAVDASYGGPKRRRDDKASRIIAEQFGAATTTTPQQWEGGNLLSNGQGLLVTTTQSINENIARGYDLDTVTGFLKELFGATQVVVLEHLVGEPTAHVDVFACFTGPGTIVVGHYDASADPQNAAVLDRNAARLAEVRTRGGMLNVVRIPMPSNEDGAWRSFANVVFANGTLLVPVYPQTDAAAGKEALAIYRRLLPEWNVVGVDAGNMARHQGGLRCVTLYVPEVEALQHDRTARGSAPDTEP
jgi:agmatine deiminase